MPHDPFKGLSNGVGRMCLVCLNGQRVARGGLIDMRAQAEVYSALWYL